MTLQPEQLALVRLMQAGSDYVEEWRALFQGAMIRVRTASGRTCTVTVTTIESLLSAGVIAPSWGGTFTLTDEGKRL
jgi:hypothetical protein